MKSRIFAAVILLTMMSLPGFASGKNDSASSIEKFDQWGFKIEIPTPFEKHVLATKPGEKLSVVYVTGGLAYFVRIIDVSPDVPSSTALEQNLQTEMKRNSVTGHPKRWERRSSYGELFKGISTPTQLDTKSSPWLAQILGSDTAFMSASMAPLAGDSSPILTVGIIGPSAQATKIENMAEYLVSTVSKFKVKLASNAPIPAPKKTANAAPKNNPVQSPMVAAPKPAKAPSVAKPVGPVALKKDDIELFGSVDKITPEDGSLTMIVDQIRLRKEGIVKFAQPRSKLVFCKKLPAGVVVGTRLRVIGKNAGVGKPLNADSIRVEPEVKPATPA